MRVPMVQVRHMRVVVDERCVPVGMAVRFAWWIGSGVVVMVVLVVRVRVFVLQRFVGVLMAVPFA